ncbi:MAG: hypothetical protein KGN36_21670 [Acidobacteriota bacterium]|nr:hypothetical protein [Acidobacteriota bacterium]
MEVFAEEDEFIFAIAAESGAGGGAMLVALDVFGGAGDIVGGFEDAGADELGDERQFVGGESAEEAAGARAHAAFGARGQRRDQGIARDRPTNHIQRGC